MKQVLLTKEAELETPVVINVFNLLENKFKNEPWVRIEESLKFLLVYTKDIGDARLGSLTSLILTNEGL